MKTHYIPFQIALLSVVVSAQANNNAWYEGDFSFEFSYSRNLYESMDEPYTFSPLQPLGSGTQSTTQIEWTRNWEEEYYLFTPAYAISPFKYIIFQAGVNMGTCDSSFNAATVNAASSTSETWHMNDSFAWGPLLNIMVAADKRGVYARLGFNMLETEGDEDKEILISDFGNSGDDRDAFFKWRTEIYELETGYIQNKITVALGARITAFKARKWLTHNIDESNAQNPRQAEIIRQLNSEPSHYHYKNTEKLSPYASLKLTPHPKISIEFSGSLDDSEQYSATCSVGF